MVYLTRKSHFSASHRLFNPNLSDEQNYAIYEECSNPRGHGHNYVLEITVCGVPDKETGYFLDIKKFKKIIEEYIISKVDHKNLNFDVEFLEGIIPTMENMVVIFWNQIANKIPYGKLYKIKIWETENNSIEYFGEEFPIKKFEN